MPMKGQEMSTVSSQPGSAALRGLTPPTRRGRSTRMLGEVVVDLGMATPEQIETALGRARAERKLIGRMLVEMGILDADSLSRAVAERFGLDHVNLNEYSVDPGASSLIPAAAARRYGAMPIGWASPSTLLVAMSDPANIVAIDDIGMMTGHDVRPVIVSREDLEPLIARLTRLDDAVETAAEDEDGDPLKAGEDVGSPVSVSEDDAPVIKLVNSIVAQAVEQGASDIHFSPHQGDMRVQYRIDGVLGDGVTIPRKLRQGLVSRVKIMAELDIAERRAPQDGRFGLTVEGKPIDVRVVTLPLVGGESVVMRILDRSGTLFGMEQLGMLAPEEARFEKAFRQAYGAVLVTGPTGSGKTTTLYAALNELNTMERSIVTIEDPVEYRIDGLRQMQINPKAGVTFATGLRSMMRADPDIVMVGEIRDQETAHISIEAALTGHLVLSTLHTNDAPTAISRLIEMGVEPFLVASAIDCVVAQRLARRLCSSCKKEKTYPAEIMLESGFRVDDDVQAFEPVGCARCSGSGYKGRLGLYEVMSVTEEIRVLALARDTASNIGAVAAEQGMHRLRDDGLAKVLTGDTSLAEVARVSGTS
jgi:type IV pilus assembly protein PilB